MRAINGLGAVAAMMAIAAALPGTAAAETAPACKPACDTGQTCVNGACALSSAASSARPAAADSSGSPPAVAAPGRARGVPGASARWHEGFMVIPSVGFDSLQGTSGQGQGLGLRASLLAGSRMAENWSLNVALTFDKLNPDSAPGESVSAYAFDVSFSPLIHFPQPKFEILAGPILGTWVSTSSASAGQISNDIWGYGWTIGGNVGLLVPVGSKVELGGLLTLSVRNVMKLCTTVLGNETCASSGVDAAKALGLAFAAMF